MAKKGRGRGRGRVKRIARKMIPLLPVLIGTAPLIVDGAHVAVDIKNGMSPGAAGALGLARVQSLYGGRAKESSTIDGIPVEYSMRVGYGALIAAVALHFAFRAAGLSNVKLAKGVKLA